jgi:hypothetical protein
MNFRRRYVDPNAPTIRRQAQRYERKLRKILSMAGRRDSRRDPVFARLYSEAKVEGINLRHPTKTASIEFKSPPLKGTLFEIYDWSSLDEFSLEIHAQSLAWAIRERVKEERRGQ